MMVPFADFLNHLPLDTQFEVFNLMHSNTKQTDFSQLYSKKFLEDLDPELEIKIKGCPKVQNKLKRQVLLTELSQKFLKNMFSNSESLKVWEQGYISTDVAEDNDDSSDSSSSSADDNTDKQEDDEYYDEEDEEQEEPDIEEMILQEKLSKGLTDIEKEFI